MMKPVSMQFPLPRATCFLYHESGQDWFTPECAIALQISYDTLSSINSRGGQKYGFDPNYFFSM